MHNVRMTSKVELRLAARAFTAAAFAALGNGLVSLAAAASALVLVLAIGCGVMGWRCQLALPRWRLDRARLRRCLLCAATAKWLAMPTHVLSAVAGVWMPIVITSFEGG